MEAYIHLHSSKQDCEKGQTEGLTKMILHKAPMIGDEIVIEFPREFINQNKWFKKIPDRP